MNAVDCADNVIAPEDSYPWWPAVVFEDDDAEVPKSVLERCPAPGDNSKVLVRFYEKERKKNKLNNWCVHRVPLRGRGS